MTLRLLTLFAGAALSLSACTDGGKDTGAEGDTDTDTDADTDTDTDTDAGYPLAAGIAIDGVMATAFWDGSLIDQYAVVGTTVSCSGCLYAFDGDFTGSVSNFSRTVTIDEVPGYAGYGYVYGGSDFWGIAYDDGASTTEFSNYFLYYYYGANVESYAAYYYGGYLYR